MVQNRLRAPRMAKALGDWTLFFILRHIIRRGEVFVLSTSLTFLIPTVVHEVSPMMAESGGHIRMKQILPEKFK